MPTTWSTDSGRHDDAPTPRPPVMHRVPLTTSAQRRGRRARLALKAQIDASGLAQRTPGDSLV